MRGPGKGLTDAGRRGHAIHRDAVLGLLHQHAQLTRAEVAHHLGIARSTVSETVGVLLTEGVVVIDRVRDPDGRGRPAEVLSLDPRAGFHLGVEIAYQRITVLVTNARGEVIGRRTTGCAVTLSWPDRLAIAVGLADALGTTGIVDYTSLRGVAVGLPGPYSHRPRTGDRPRHDAVGELAANLFGSRFAAPVVVDLHVRFAALAEAAAREGDCDDLLYLRLSTGVGAALVSDGRPVRGRHGRAGELGHSPVVAPDDPAARDCRCGSRGCLETIASVPAVLRDCRAGGVEVRDLTELTVRFSAGDPVVDAVVERVVAGIAMVVGGTIPAVAPEQVVLAGELPAALGSEFVARVAAAVAPHAFPRTDPPRVSAALLGDDAATLGAVAVLRQSAPAARTTTTQGESP